MKIADAELVLLEYPFHGYFKFIGARAVRPAIVVKLTAEDGTVGWGQSLPVPTWSFETLETAEIVLRRHFLPAVLGRDALDLEGAEAAMDRALAASFSTPLPISRSGVDLALHDLAGKLTGRSVCELWGRPPGGPVRLSWTVDVHDLDALEAAIEAGRAQGYHNFNIKVGGRPPDLDVELARRVRQPAPDGFLWADANGGYDLATALEIAPRLADAGVDVLESPLPANCLSGYQALRRQGAVPITMDEGVISPRDVEEFIRLGMMDGLTIKISRCGGLWAARQQIERVLDAGLFWLGSGLTDPDLSLAASLALFGAFGLARPAALNGPQFLRDHILRQPLSVEGDLAQVPCGPGLGVDVDEVCLPSLLAQK